MTFIPHSLKIEIVILAADRSNAVASFSLGYFVFSANFGVVPPRGKSAKLAPPTYFPS